MCLQTGVFHSVCASIIYHLSSISVCASIIYHLSVFVHLSSISVCASIIYQCLCIYHLSVYQCIVHLSSISVCASIIYHLSVFVHLSSHVAGIFSCIALSCNDLCLSCIALMPASIFTISGQIKHAHLWSTHYRFGFYECLASIIYQCVCILSMNQSNVYWYHHWMLIIICLSQLNLLHRQIAVSLHLLSPPHPPPSIIPPKKVFVHLIMFYLLT